MACVWRLESELVTAETLNMLTPTPGRLQPCPRLNLRQQDDQDYVLGGADALWMPALDKYVRRQGALGG